MIFFPSFVNFSTMFAVVIGLAMCVSAQDDTKQTEPKKVHSILKTKMRTSTSGQMSVIEQSYGKTFDGKEISEFVCKNSSGSTMRLITYGATMTALELPDRSGKRSNIILTCPNIEAYQKCQSYFGSSVGRFCNRIAGGKFSLNGQAFKLAVNNGPNHLHGGVKGFDKVVWEAEPVLTESSAGAKFKYISPDGDEGYPGQLTVTVQYMLSNENEMSVEFRATTDKPTPVNLTNHNYWNLAGHKSGTILDHRLKVEADKFLEADETLIPTGNLLDVVGTPLDFLTARKMGERFQDLTADPKGYDHCFSIREFDGSLRLAATVTDPASGRIMEIHTTQPGLQFYTGNFLDGSEGSGGYKQYSAFCLETQHYPDSPNHANFPSSTLNPGDEYVQKTVHRFTIQK